MQTTRFTPLPGLAIAILCTLLGVGGCGGDDNDDSSSTTSQTQAIVGSWNVTLRFPASSCNNACNCPGGVPNIPVLTLNTYEEDGVLQVALGALAAGPGQGTWTRLDDTHVTARFKFLIFDVATGRRTGSEELTKDIRLTGPDTFEATTTFDLFDAARSLAANGCIINETATRFK